MRNKPDKIKYVIWHNEKQLCIEIVDRCFGRYYMTITGLLESANVTYYATNEKTVRETLHLYEAANDPAVWLMFPHWGAWNF